MTADRKSTPGLTLAALGSTGLIISLWEPWYSFSFPAAALDQVEQSSSQYGVLGPLINQGAELIRRLGTLHVTAWQAYTFVPAVLLVAGVIAGGLSLLTLSGRATSVPGVVTKVGAAALGAVVYRMIDRPGNSDYFHIAWGMYLAVGCALAVVAGGAMAASSENVARAPVVPTAPEPPPATWSTADSTAPPSL
jgi:hypothetical protein